MFDCFPWRSFARVSPVIEAQVSSLPEIEEEVPECPICLEKLVFDRALEPIVACSNPQVSHKFHRDCIEGCRDRFYVNQHVSCPLGCQGVFLGIKGVLVRSYWADIPWIEEDSYHDFQVHIADNESDSEDVLEIR